MRAGWLEGHGQRKVVAQAPSSLAQTVELLLYNLRSVAVALLVWDSKGA
jgi:hypothetical protein